jgi:amidase
VVLPTLAQRPVPINEINGNQSDPWESQRRAGHFTPYTAIVNVTGLPAISLPLYQGEDGLPTAVQLVGPPAREDVLLSLSTQLERARPWADRRPPLAAAAPSSR